MFQVAANGQLRHQEEMGRPKKPAYALDARQRPVPLAKAPMSTTEVGNAGARRAAAVIGLAVCAETSHATLSEDSAKVDLKISLRHAYVRSADLTVHCQVKAGASYEEKSLDGQVIALSLDSETLSALRLGTQPAMIAWVPPRPSTHVYCQVLTERDTLKSRIKMPVNSFVTPALRFEISRAHAFREPTGPRVRVDMTPRLQGVMQRARTTYRQIEVIDNPMVGKLHVTRLAWRHVTRRSKIAARRTASLQAVPYLEHILKQKPDRYRLAEREFLVAGERTLERRTILLWYNDSLRLGGEVRSLMVRVREDVTYPRDWMMYPLSITDVQQCATLASWWCKR